MREVPWVSISTFHQYKTYLLRKTKYDGIMQKGTRFLSEALTSFLVASPWGTMQATRYLSSPSSPMANTTQAFTWDSSSSAASTACKIMCYIIILHKSVALHTFSDGISNISILRTQRVDVFLFLLSLHQYCVTFLLALKTKGPYIIKCSMMAFCLK